MTSKTDCKAIPHQTHSSSCGFPFVSSFSSCSCLHTYFKKITCCYRKDPHMLGAGLWWPVLWAVVFFRNVTAMVGKGLL